MNNLTPLYKYKFVLKNVIVKKVLLLLEHIISILELIFFSMCVKKQQKISFKNSIKQVRLFLY